MSFLETDEVVKLQGILQKHPLLENSRTRISVLKLSGIHYLVPLIDTNEALGNFAAILLTELIEPHLTAAGGKPVLVALLSYLRGTHSNRFTSQDITFIDAVIQRCQQWYEACNPQKVALQNTYAAENQQGADAIPGVESTVKLNFREKIITEYDLEKAMAAFKRPLMQGQAFGFTVASEMVFLQNYVIQRIRYEFQKEIPGDIFMPPLTLEVQDLQSFTTLQTLLEEKIKQQFNYQKASELITRHSKEHVMLILWNQGLPSDVLKEIVIAFWQRFVPCIKVYLYRRSRCFLLILAHLSPESDPCIIEGFQTLELEAIDVQGSVIPFLTRRLPILNVSPRDKNYCIDLFNRESSINQLQFLLKMEHIASYLQGKYDGKRYPEKTYARRGR